MAQGGRVHLNIAVHLPGLPQQAVNVTHPLFATAHLVQTDSEWTQCGGSAERPTPSSPVVRAEHRRSTPGASRLLVVGTPGASGLLAVGTPVPPVETDPGDLPPQATSKPPPMSKVLTTATLPGEPQSGTDVADSSTEVTSCLLARIDELENEVQRQKRALAAALTRDVWVSKGGCGDRYHIASRCGGFAGNDSKVLTLCKTCRDRMGL